MKKKVYEIMIFKLDQLIYYYEPSRIADNQPNYQQLRNSHRIQNCLGVSQSILALVKKLHPDRKTQFRNFITKEYQYNLYDTLNGLKIILITSIRSNDSPNQALILIYQSYLNFVNKNYLYKPGGIIKNARFADEVVKTIKLLDQ